jgi:hypothetical protein
MALTTSAIKAGNTLLSQTNPTGYDSETGKYTTTAAPTVTVGDAVSVGETTYYVKAVTTSGSFGFSLAATPDGTVLTGTGAASPSAALLAGTGISYIDSYADSPADSLAFDQVGTIAGLNNLNADLDGEATIQATTTAKSTASTTGVSGNLASLAEIASNAGLTSDNAGTTTINVASNATVNNNSGSTLSATASTTDGNSASVANLGISAGIEELSSLVVGGNLTMQGKSTAGISASSETVTGEAGAASTLSGSQVGIQTTGLADIKADASIQGITQLTNTATAATFNSNSSAPGFTNLAGAIGADALADAGNIQGSSLSALEIGGIGSVLGQASLTNNATATNVEGAATAFSKQGGGAAGTVNDFMEGLDLKGAMDVKSDAGINGVANLTGKAVASTTKGAATADAEANILNGADLTGGTVDVGGIGDLKGSLNYGLTAEATNVDDGDTANTSTNVVNADAQANSGFGLKGAINTATNPQDETTGSIGVDIASDGQLSGLSIGSLTAKASSTADSAKATAGGGDTSVGAQLPSLDIGGIGQITAGAQLTSTASAESVGGNTTAQAGLLGSVTGLTSGEDEPIRQVISTSAGAKDFTEKDGATGVTNPYTNLIDNFNINVSSDATIGAQAFSNLNATATSTAGIAKAEAGGLTGEGLDATTGNTVTGIAAGMDIKVGGIGNLTTLAQGTANATANSVTNNADALGAMGAMGINQLEMQTSSDATLKSTASLVGNATATTTGDTTGTTETAWAGLDLGSTAISGLALDVGGIGNLTANAAVTGKATSEVVTGDADTRTEIDAMGIDNAWIHTASDGNITGTGILNLDVSAASTAGSAKAEGDFDATGAKSIYIGNTEFDAGGTGDDFVGIGGVANLKGQAQVTATMDANSVTGTADAFSGMNLGGVGTMDFTANGSRIVGLEDVDLRGASDGTILGTAKGVFSTMASTTGDGGSDNATAKAAQSLFGINDLNLNLGGMGQINAIVNDTNFVGAQSVSGNATAVSSIDAIGLAGGDMHIAGNATIMATVGVDSKSEAQTVA